MVKATCTKKKSAPNIELEADFELSVSVLSIIPELFALANSMVDLFPLQNVESNTPNSF
jgi:hypothetical protein